MHDWSNAATLVVAVAAVHQYALDAAHQSSHKLICEHCPMSDWSDSVTLVVVVAAVHYCALDAPHESSHQFQSIFDWKHFATFVVAIAAMHQYALDAAHQSSHQSICEHQSMHDWSSEQLWWML